MEKPGKYQRENLPEVLRDENHKADLASVVFAIQKYKGQDVGRRVSQSGPLPYSASERAKYYDAVSRGLMEFDIFLNASGIGVSLTSIAISISLMIQLPPLHVQRQRVSMFCL